MFPIKKLLLSSQTTGAKPKRLYYDNLQPPSAESDRHTIR
uniref:Uncharacterized protein n=1 Tax=Myoviridae sp. ctP6q2 TaxID=2825096 RepID=A0A8S5UV09_9CAUD|nr:MAG TPA: hypothetical protein [Myoviridae sp. ctP6q2]DAJ61495.1 MAG TPA: hypothetical protein [Caudoviricetes sp.]DAU69088.1 MAG TPA: hypothetical protein [Caudoviricetes sp.]